LKQNEDFFKGQSELICVKFQFNWPSGIWGKIQFNIQLTIFDRVWWPYWISNQM